LVGNRTTVLHWRCAARLCRPAAPPPPPVAHRLAGDCGRQVDSIGFDSCPTSPTVSLIGGQSDNCSILGARRAFAVPPSHRTAAPPLPAAARRLAGETLDAKSTQPISLPPPYRRRAALVAQFITKEEESTLFLGVATAHYTDCSVSCTRC
jgi:hypothetical protein